MLTKWIIDGRKKPWPTSELFVGYDSHESVRRGQKLRPRLVHASIARGIIESVYYTKTINISQHFNQLMQLADLRQNSIMQAILC